MKTLKLAVLGCKGRKENHPCSARDMYMPSPLHKAQISFVEAYYDAYIILSAKHEVMFPTDIIEPYSMMVVQNKSKFVVYSPDTIVLTLPERKIWAQNICNHEVFMREWVHVDFHVPNLYWQYLKKYKQDNWRVIKFPEFHDKVSNVQRYKNRYQSVIDGVEPEMEWL